MNKIFTVIILLIGISAVCSSRLRRNLAEDDEEAANKRMEDFQKKWKE